MAGLIRMRLSEITREYLMKTILTGFLLAASFTANATLITYTDTYNPNPDIFMSGGSMETFTHDINDDGFNTGTDSILSVMLELDIVDDGDYDYNTYSSYRYTTWCGRHSRFGSYHCHYGYGTRISSYGQPETLTVDADGTVFGTYEIDYNPLGFEINIDDLQIDGLLDITLSMISGDAYFRSSILTVNLDRAESVPEPNTALLLGLGLLGFIYTRRKKQSI